MKFCTKCGAQLNDGAKFCSKCGAPVAVRAEESSKTESEPVVRQSIPQEEPTVQQPVQQTTPTAPQKEIGKKPSVPLIIGIIAAVVVLAVAGIFAFKKLSGPDLVGTWQDAYGISSFAFNKDGSCSIDTWGDSVEGTYEVKNGVISMTFADFLTEQFPYEIDKKNKNRMTLYDPDTGEGLVYTRVKEGGSGTEAETEAETAPETVPQTVAETAPQAIAETVPQTVAESSAAETTPAESESKAESVQYEYVLFCSAFDAGKFAQDGSTGLVNVKYDANNFSCDYIAPYGIEHIESNHSYGLNTNSLTDNYKSDALVYSYQTVLGDAYVDVFEKEGIIRITPVGEDGIGYFTDGSDMDIVNMLLPVDYSGTVTSSASDGEQTALESSVADCFLKYGTKTEEYNLTLDALFTEGCSVIDRGDYFEITNCRMDVYDNIPASVFEGKIPGDEITWRGVTYRITNINSSWIDMEKLENYSDPYFASKTEFGYRIGSIDEWTLTRTVYEGSVFFDKSCIIEGYQEGSYTDTQEYFVTGLGDSKWERGFEYGMSNSGFRTYGYIREIGQDGRITYFKECFTQ